MEPWGWLFIIIMLGLGAWFYAISSMNAYDPHRPIVPEPWNIGGEEE